MAEGRCKKVLFDNCCPIQDSDDYCLFHKPGKNEKEAEKFYEKLKEQATLEPDENGGEKVVFNNDVKWRGYVFPEGHEEDFFRVATFKRMADFGDANFEGEAHFRNTTFGKWADFGRVTFKGGAHFRDATFGDWAFFEQATFEGESNFLSAIFEEAAFFKNANFKNMANFIGSSFKKDALFEGVLFERTCNFSGSKFEGELFFTITEFRQGVVMEEGWKNKAKGWKKPEPGKYKFPQAEQEGCRVQKLSFEKEGNKEAADAMFAREMRARGKEKIFLEPKLLWKMPGKYIFYCLETMVIDKTCKYGTDWYSLFKATLLVIVSFSLIYFLSYFNIGFLGNLGQSSFYSFNFEWSWVLFIELCHALLQSFIFSIVNFTTLGSDILNPGGLIISFIVGLQSLIGAFFIALFVVVFARKWMR